MADQPTVRIAVLGVGNVGATLARAWHRAGHGVRARRARHGEAGLAGTGRRADGAAVDGLAMVWFAHAFGQAGRHLGLKVITP